MDDLIRQGMAILQGMWQRRWLGLAAAWIVGIMKSLKIDSLGRDNLYTLTYRDPKPEKAKRVVQSLASIFIESNLGAKRKDSDSAKKFIDEQIKVYEKKLEEAEDRLKEFKIRHMTANDAPDKDYFGRLQELT